jgi:ectoine hydroxylase-related dioxygenase (phytanoyl-CoA dioxygenase family)
MPNKLTDNHIDELEERGYVIVHDFLDEGQRQEIAAAVRKILKPWND